MTDDLIRLALRCKSTVKLKPENVTRVCNSPLVRLHVIGSAVVSVTCPACRQAWEIEWSALGVRAVQVVE